MADVLTDSAGALPPILNDRLLPRTRGVSRRRTLNHRARLAAKQYHERHPDSVPCESNGLSCCYRDPQRARLDRQHPSRARRHAEEDIKLNSVRSAGTTPRKARHSGRPLLNDNDDLALARSNAALPSDRRPSLQRTPSLEREDAFCDARTYKGKVHTKQMPTVPADNDDAQVAELYRMGLLYDEADKKNSDAAFDLNDIRHDEPVYSIRPARRGRKAKTVGFDGALPLDLSFADLAQDDELAQFFTTNPHTPTSSQEDIPPRTESAPLRVIYELSTQSPSFDVDTSQPPDLMDDEDYDCFSDFELDDESPSQREIHSPHEASGPWVLLGDDS